MASGKVRKRGWKLPPRSEEHRRKLSEAAKKRLADPDFKERHAQARRGKSPSSETRRKLSESWQKNWNDPEKREKLRVQKLNAAASRKTATYPERRMAHLLDEHDVLYVFQQRIGPYLVDFLVLPHVVLEVDGEYWHAKHKERDRQRDAFLEKQGFKVIRIPAAKLARGMLKTDLERIKPPCKICGRQNQILRRLRCPACAAHFQKHGTERPPERWAVAYSDERREAMSQAAKRRSRKDKTA